MTGMNAQRPGSASTVDAGRPRPDAAALLARLEVLEDGRDRDVDDVFADAVEIEHAAGAIGDQVLQLRARLLQADMLERKGETRQGARTFWDIHGWAVANECRTLLARTHLLLARTHANLGDMAACLDHSVSALRHPRLPLTLRDVSVGGLSAISPAPVTVGERLSVVLPRQEGAGSASAGGWDARGRVLRCEPAALGFRIAVQFDALPLAA